MTTVQNKKIQSQSMQKLLFWLCWLAYFSTYLGRLNYSAGLTEIIRAEGYDKGAAGLIGTAFFCSYGIGQLFSGFMGDEWKPQKMIFAGILGSGVCNILMGLTTELWQMVVAWCVNGLLQALIWSPIIKLFSNWIPSKNQKKFCININTSVPVGTFAAYSITAFIVWKWHWRNVFFFASVCLFLITFFWMLGMKKIEKDVKQNGVYEKNTEVDKEKEHGNVSLKKLIFVSGMIFLCFGLMFQGILKDGVTTWIPTYIREMFHVDSAASIISTTIIPMFNLGGVYLAGAANNKIFHNEIMTSAFFFITSGISFLLLRVFAGASMMTVLVLFGIATTAMMAVNTMLVSVVPIYFAPYGKSSTASGILNSSAYAGGALSTYAIGVLSEIMGWNVTINIWIGVAAAGTIACIIGKVHWQKFTRKVQLGQLTTGGKK